MSHPIVYILLPVCGRSVCWIEQMLTILAGGYDVGRYRLKPVLMSPDNGPEEKSLLEGIATLIGHYASAREQLHEHNRDLFVSEVFPPTMLLGGAGGFAHDGMFWQDSLTMQRAIRWGVAFLNRLKPDFEAGDRLVVTAYMEHDVSELALVEAVLAYLAPDAGENADAITAVCELAFRDSHGLVSMNAQPTTVSDALQLIGERCRLTVTGMRSDAHKTDFTCIQHACAILDAIRLKVQGVPVVRGQNLDLCYTPNHLASRYSAMALLRMSLLGRLQLGMTESLLGKWRNSLHVEGLLEDIRLFSALSQPLSDMRRWQQTADSSVMTFAAAGTVCRQAAERLNSIKCLPPTSSNEQRRREAMRSLLQAVTETIPLDSSNAEYAPLLLSSDKPVNWCYKLGEQPLGLSPTQAFELTDRAFAPMFAHDAVARTWRAACLDLWELFFTFRKPQVETVLSVEECRLSLKASGDIVRLLRFTSVGQRLLADDIFYCIFHRNGDFAACSSPLTGFCVTAAQTDYIDIEGRSFFVKNPSEALELEQRSEQVQQFIHAYIGMQKNAFSDNFRQYVAYQTEKHSAKFQAAGTNVIRLYPDFCSHVGIDISSKEKLQ